MIFNCISYIRIKAGYVLFSSKKQDMNEKQRRDENCYYIIEKGKLEYRIDDYEYTLGKHECISTQALTINSKDSYFLQSKERCYLFSFSVEKFKNIITDFVNQFQKEKISILMNVYFFKWMDQKLLGQIANLITIKQYKKQTLIIKEETNPKALYIISEGEVSCGKNDHIIKKLKEYSIFGHMAIFAQNESLYSFTAEEDTTLLAIKKEDFLDCCGENPVKLITYNMFAYSVKSSSLLSKYYDDENIQSLFDIFQLKYYFSDIIVYRKQKKMLLLIGGSLYKSINADKLRGVASLKYNQDDEIVNDCSLYGEELLACEDQTSSFVISTDECVLFEAQWKDILKITRSTNKISSLYDQVHLIKTHPYFKGICELKLFRLGEGLKLAKFKPNDLILKDGPSSDKFYKIRFGRVKIKINNMDGKILEEGQCFGDIISQSGSYLTTANYIALTAVECFYLEKELYDELFDCEILQPFKSILNVKDITVTLDQLYYIKELGQGSYGKVFLVHDKKRPYAMKTAEIKEMIKNKESAQLYLNEKSIMSSIDHPFIVQLINTFKTREYIFFLLEYVDGMTLKAGLQTRKPSQLRNCSNAAFYGGIFSNILNYLQRNKIIHRDLKPDNIMIDKIGYLKAIDFGIAKKLIGKDSTHSIIGTIQYMAPEIVHGRNYSFAVDYWSVGIILYEIFYGKIPFGYGLTDPVLIYKEITEKKPSLNSEVQSEAFNSLIKKLLKKNPNKRISSYSKLKSQPLLALIDYVSRIILRYNLIG